MGLRGYLRREARGTFAAESEIRWVLKTALRTAWAERTSTLAAKLHPFRIFESTGRAKHPPDLLGNEATKEIPVRFY